MSDRCERTSEQTSGRASGPVLTFRFQEVLNHCEAEKMKEESDGILSHSISKYDTNYESTLANVTNRRSGSGGGGGGDGNGEGGGGVNDEREAGTVGNDEIYSVIRENVENTKQTSSALRYRIA